MKDLIWYEKFRPLELKQLVLSPQMRKVFKKFIKEKEIPHLLFYGPPGGGKTTLAHILISSCAGRYLILNASSEDRGIGVIKTRVKQFATAKHPGNKLNIVFFDEANGLTSDAQEALKNTIEKYQKNCRFIFATNEIHKITEPILSRCQVFQFDSFPKESLIRALRKILVKENVEFTQKKLIKIVDQYYPDIRTIMNTLQSCSITGKLDTKELLSANTKMISMYLKKGKIFALRHMFNNSADFLWVYRFLFNKYIVKNFKDNQDRSDACLIVAEYLWRDRTVVDKEINLAACFLELMSLNKTEVDFDEPF